MIDLRVVGNTSIALAKKYAPEILLTTGVVGTGAATVMACRRTLRASELLEEHKFNFPTEEDNKKCVLELAKLYAPPIIIGGLSIAAILMSHRILADRTRALSLAFASGSASLTSLRKKVEERTSKNKELEVFHNVTKETVVLDDDPDRLPVEQTVTLAKLDNEHLFTRLYCKDTVEGFCTLEGCGPNYRFFNKYTLSTAETYFNTILPIKGYISFNDVLEYLGFERTWYGDYYGWIYKDPNEYVAMHGDNYISFGIYDNPDFVNETSDSILLTFNVDPMPIIDDGPGVFFRPDRQAKDIPTINIV